MIEAVDIHKAYGELEVLKGINIEVKQKEVISIVGASGAGKSTLLHILGTLDKANKGKVIINKEDTSTISGKRLSQFRNKNIGFIFQFHHLLPEFTALENVCMPAYIKGTSRRSAEERAKELLSYLGLSGRLSHKPSELSGGELQRIAVARALVNNPAVVLADEPSGNLDSANAKDLHELFFKLRDELGQTFIVATHNEKLANMADRMLLMKDGVIAK